MRRRDRRPGSTNCCGIDRLTQLPPVALRLGYAGLLPQLVAVAALASGDLDWRFTALAAAFAYAALILSFLGGIWWGIAASVAGRAPAWLWIVAVVPSLVAFASAIPWVIGAPWPGPSLLVLGSALIAALAVDLRLVRLGLAPAAWMALRAPLSLGLGGLTILAALL